MAPSKSAPKGVSDLEIEQLLTSLTEVDNARLWELVTEWLHDVAPNPDWLAEILTSLLDAADLNFASTAKILSKTAEDETVAGASVEKKEDLARAILDCMPNDPTKYPELFRIATETLTLMPEETVNALDGDVAGDWREIIKAMFRSLKN